MRPTSWTALFGLLLACACEEVYEPEGGMSRAQLLDPENCKSCHPNHYDEWAASMHAYAATDPVFLAMNRRGQEETGGELGAFCVNCHAPMAVREGAIEDFARLEDIPDHLKGVTCYFCHNAVSVDGDHNAMISLANDTTMRGGFGRGTPDDPRPARNAAHRAEYSLLHDRFGHGGTALCGSCHDIVTPAGVHLERTFAEYKNSVYSGVALQTCQQCHMPLSTGIAADDPDSDVRTRQVHGHRFIGVDVALDQDSPYLDEQLAAVKCALHGTAQIVKVEPDEDATRIRVVLETLAGHRQPSGASQDRRMWLEFIAYDDAGNVMLESGTVEDGAIEEYPEGHERHDPLLWMLRDRIYDANGEKVHMFWDAAPSDGFPEGYSVGTLPENTGGDHTVDRYYPVADPARIKLRLRMRPMGIDVLRDLVDSEHLDPEVIARMPTFTIRSGQWTRESRRFVADPRDDACEAAY